MVNLCPDGLVTIRDDHFPRSCLQTGSYTLINATRSTKAEIRYVSDVLFRVSRDQRLLEEDPKGNKTVKLPHGTLKARKQQDKWEYDDETIIEWAKANKSLSLIRIKEEPDKQAIKEYVKMTGEVIPGVTITPQGLKFNVEVEL
jgi:phage host-nuclease inhibitor protein Gam